jgi:hypothetical protein
MNTCNVCGKPVTAEQSSIEHITPLSRGGKNIETNMRIVHIQCHRMSLPLWKRILRRIGYYRWKLTMWWDRVKAPMCYKESLGYRCHHRVYKDGFKECGGPADRVGL